MSLFFSTLSAAHSSGTTFGAWDAHAVSKARHSFETNSRASVQAASGSFSFARDARFNARRYIEFLLKPDGPNFGCWCRPPSRELDGPPIMMHNADRTIPGDYAMRSTRQPLFFPERACDSGRLSPASACAAHTKNARIRCVVAQPCDLYWLFEHALILGPIPPSAARERPHALPSDVDFPGNGTQLLRSSLAFISPRRTARGYFPYFSGFADGTGTGLGP